MQLFVTQVVCHALRISIFRVDRLYAVLDCDWRGQSALQERTGSLKLFVTGEAVQALRSSPVMDRLYATLLNWSGCSGSTQLSNNGQALNARQAL
jgi:hypothetical protein